LLASLGFFAIFSVPPFCLFFGIRVVILRFRFSDSMSLVPSTASRGLTSAASVVDAIKIMRDAFSDRQALDAAISAQDAKDWELLSTGSAVGKSPVKNVRQSNGARAIGGGRAGPGSMINKRDLMIKPPSNSIPRSLPRNFLYDPFFDRVTTRNPQLLSTTADTEFNYSFNLATHPAQSSLVTLFDQWCIVMASVTLFNPLAPGISTVPVAMIHSAIDFDSTGTIGRSKIDQFDTIQVCALGTGAKSSHTRSCKPCNAADLSGSNGSGVTRLWCDSAVTSTPWFGVRFIAEQQPTASALVTETSVWYAFRGRV
jgi:hypothetical protein